VSPQGTLTAKDVKPTTSKQVEGGVKYLLADYATTFTASVFNIRQKNVVTSDPGFLNYRQTGEVESKGAELSAISRPTDNLTLIANYAYTHAINTEDDKYKGKRPTQVPENAFNLWGDYTFDSTPLKGLMLGLGHATPGRWKFHRLTMRVNWAAPRSTIWRPRTGWAKSCLRWRD
jgi:iron complex outermembrane receptor protein